MKAREIVAQFLRERPLGFEDTMGTTPVEHMEEFVSWVLRGTLEDDISVPEGETEVVVARVLAILHSDRMRMTTEVNALALTEADKLEVVSAVRQGQYSRALRVALAHPAMKAMVAPYLEGVIDGRRVLLAGEPTS